MLDPKHFHYYMFRLRIIKILLDEVYNLQMHPTFHTGSDYDSLMSPVPGFACAILFKVLNSTLT